jgi:hypothetical protein
VKKSLLSVTVISVGVLAASLFATPAMATHVGVGINIGVPVYAAPPPPVYYAPAPVYAPPPPVYVRPAPVYYAPAPVYVERGYYHRGPGYYRHGPRYHGHGHYDRHDYRR